MAYQAAGRLGLICTFVLIEVVGCHVREPTIPIGSFGSRELATFIDEEILLSEAQVTRCLQSVKHLNDRLEEEDSRDGAALRFLLSGPLAKGIALSTTKSIDVAFYLDPASAPPDKEGLGTWVLARLRKLIPSLELTEEQPSVPAVSFRMTGAPYPIRLTPVYDDSAADGGGFQFAKETGLKVRTSIPLRIEFTLRRAANRSNGFAQTYGLVEFLLERKRVSDPSFHFKSFLTELLLARLFDLHVDMTDPSEAIERVFQYIDETGLKEPIAFSDYYEEDEVPASGEDPMEIYDPITPTNNVAVAYDESDRRRVVQFASETLQLLRAARASTTREEALTKWGALLGPSFMEQTSQ